MCVLKNRFRGRWDEKVGEPLSYSNQECTKYPTNETHDKQCNENLCFELALNCYFSQTKWNDSSVVCLRSAGDYSNTKFAKNHSKHCFYLKFLMDFINENHHFDTRLIAADCSSNISRILYNWINWSWEINVNMYSLFFFAT